MPYDHAMTVSLPDEGEWIDSTDAELMEAIRLWNDDRPFALGAFQALYARHAQFVANQCANACQARPLRDFGHLDLQQKIWIKVRAKADSFKPERGKLVGWLARMIHNAYMDELRARKNLPLCALPDCPEAYPAELMGYVVGDAPATRQCRWVLALRDCLQDLPTKEQTVVEASAPHYHPPDMNCTMSTEETDALATRLGTTRASVKAYRSRGLKKLRICIQHKLAEHGIDVEEKRG
jgi:RNA polymerase sigma factor (sigma-70 family)